MRKVCNKTYCLCLLTAALQCLVSAGGSCRVTAGAAGDLSRNMSHCSTAGPSQARHLLCSALNPGVCAAICRQSQVSSRQDLQHFIFSHHFQSSFSLNIIIHLIIILIYTILLLINHHPYCSLSSLNSLIILIIYHSLYSSFINHTHNHHTFQSSYS